MVVGQREYEVYLWQDDDGELDGECDCPAFEEMGLWCKHLVAVALTVLASARGDGRPIRPEPRPPARRPDPVAQAAARARAQTREFLSLFGDSIRVAAPEALLVEFTLVAPRANWGDSLALAMRVGPKRLYVAQRVRPLLAAIARGERHEFTPNFAYEPERHGFRPEDAAVLAALAPLVDDVGSGTPRRPRAGVYGYRGTSPDRALLLPPEAAPRLLPLLEAAGALLELAGGHDAAVPLRVQDPPLPLHTAVEPDGASGYVLSVDGLGAIHLMPDYGIAVAPGSLYRVDADEARRLRRLLALRDGGTDRLRVALTPDELGAAMRQVVPRLRRLSTVAISADVATRVVEAPMQAQVYVDREDPGLRVHVEWHYGDIVLRAGGATAGTEDGDARIVVRDRAKEERILAVLALGGASAWRGDVLVIETDEAVYDFLHRAVGELQPLAEVYVTDRVQALWLSDRMTPRVRLDLDLETNWLDVSFDLGEVAPEEADAVLRALIERRPYHRLRSGALVDLATPAFAGLASAAEAIGLRPGDVRSGSAHLEAYRAAFLDESELAGDDVRLGRALRRWLDVLHHPEQLDLPLPPGLVGTLRAYQARGFEWMASLARLGFGGILADDMGLGKTVQTIAFLLAERERGPFTAPALIVCPASLVYNWESELSRFAPSLRVAVAAGTATERDGVLARSGDLDVLITSYPLVLRDADRYQGMRLHALILDEAQFLKNHESKTARAVRSLTSERRFALTGTPVENSLDDLWSILRAVFPALAGPREAFTSLRPDQVRRRIRPFLLRRRKADVLRELPEKIETTASTELTPEQKKVYLSYLTRLRQDAQRDLDSTGFQQSRIKILAGLTRLRQICCHPALFVDGYSGGSGKLDLLLELLAESIDSGRHVLVFSQFTTMLRLIGTALRERGWPHFYLDGSTPPSERLALAEAFNRGERPVFLISLKAGGTGLNLTGADTVVLFDLWWNPAVEQQAADRAHRIGQRNVVQVIRLVARGTIEEHIHAMQEAKRSLIEQVVADNDEGLGALQEADVRELLALPAKASAGRS